MPTLLFCFWSSLEMFFLVSLTQLWRNCFSVSNARASTAFSDVRDLELFPLQGFGGLHISGMRRFFLRWREKAKKGEEQIVWIFFCSRLLQPEFCGNTTENDALLREDARVGCCPSLHDGEYSASKQWIFDKQTLNIRWANNSMSMIFFYGFNRTGLIWSIFLFSEHFRRISLSKSSRVFLSEDSAGLWSKAYV